MRIYYKLKPYSEGKREIIKAVYDKDLFSAPTAYSGCFYIDVAEVDPENKEICMNVFTYFNKYDEDGESKYFIDDDKELSENLEWVEYVEEVHL